MRVIGCASGRVEMHPEHMWHSFDQQCGRASSDVAEQIRIDDSMRMEISFDSKHAAAAAHGTQRCSSNTELVHKLKNQWHCVNGSVVEGADMTHVRSHKCEPWNEMADSLTDAAMNGFCVPGSRTELERWMMRFWGSQLEQLVHVL